jgi:hypothetical protein
MNKGVNIVWEDLEIRWEILMVLGAIYWQNSR